MPSCMFTGRAIDPSEAIRATRDGRTVGYVHPSVFVAADEPERLQLTLDVPDTANIDAYRDTEA